MPRRSRVLVVGVLAAVVAPFAPVPAASSEGLPRTLAAVERPGAAAVAPGFSIDFVGVQWEGEEGEASIRFRHGASWGAWHPVPHDDLHEEGRFASALIPGGDADAYQLRTAGLASQAEVVAINTTDGPRRRPTVVEAQADAATPVTSRAAWGADPSLMTWAPEFSPLQKVTVHHTATANNDDDPAATVRAIYRYHAVDRGWGDIGYQFLVDEDGTVYEGRYSDDAATTLPDATPAHHSTTNEIVTAAHVGGWNSGNLGIALLGTLSDVGPTVAAERALESLVADVEALHDGEGFEADGTGDYVNPINGNQKLGSPNLLAHRDWEATECPGDILYALLPEIRRRAAAVDETAPTVANLAVTTGRGSATFTFATDEGSTSVVEYRKAGTSTWSASAATDRLVVEHKRTLTGLLKRTLYEARVVATDAVGNTSTSAIVKFKTK